MHVMCCDQIHYTKSLIPETDKNSYLSQECNISGTPPPTRQGQHDLTKHVFGQDSITFRDALCG